MGPYSSSYCCLLLLPPQLHSLIGMSPGISIASSSSTLFQTLHTQLFFIHHFREMTLVRVTSGQNPGPAPSLSFLALQQFGLTDLPISMESFPPGLWAPTFLASPLSYCCQASSLESFFFLTKYLNIDDLRVLSGTCFSFISINSFPS